MRAEDFDKTQELIERTNAEEPQVSPAILFEILLSSSASEWPESCEGVRPLLAAVQAMLTAAANGNEKDFEHACQSLDDAEASWYADLFGDKP